MEITYKLFPHQKAVITSQEPILYARMGRGSGKSYIASMLAVISLLKGKRTLAIAQTGQAIREVLVPEIIARLNEIIPGKFKFNQTSNKIVFGKGIIYLGSYESLESLRGYTRISLIILDEAALAPPNIFEVVAFCMRDCDEQPKIRMMSTPRSANWLTEYVKKNNIPVITAKTSDNKRITEKEIELMKKASIDENSWRREFYGDEIDDENAGVLFTSNLLTSSPKFLRRNNDGYAIGIDCSGLGKDSNVIVVRNQNEILDIVEKKIASNSELCSIVRGLIMTHGKGNLSHIAIDEAYGLDLHERLSDAGIIATIVPFGGKAKNPAYANQRAEMYINLKKGIEEYGLKGITDELHRELQATKYILNNNGKIQLIPKDEIKLNIGRSPDIADALALTYTQDIIPLGLIEADREIQTRYMLEI